MEQNSSLINASKDVKEGDIIFIPSYHTAIVVNKSSSSLDVIDSNYVDGDGKEIIGRHTFTINSIKNQKYRVWKGVSYYKENYDSNSHW